MKRFLTKTGLLFTVFIWLFFGCGTMTLTAAERVQELPERPVIVIDPGHGGEKLGTKDGNTEEKYMNMTTALAMYEELCQYENVDVYLTRTEDVDLTLKERAEFAKSVNADFLFSIHYNASENHTLFGAEIWVPMEAPFNHYGYQFGREFLEPLKERGLFIRGIKTRKGEKGRDYYGIIREAKALDIPAVILEHCHVDEARDLSFCDSEDDWIQFGKEDATAVAKYLGLKSSKLGVDYSDYSLAEVNSAKAVPITIQDETPPDVCVIEFLEADYEAGLLRLSVSAADYDTPLIYYDYSLDGGLTYCPLEIWPGSDVLNETYEDTFTLNLEIPENMQPSVILRAYNLYGATTESNPYHSPAGFRETKPVTEESTASEETVTASADSEAEESSDVIMAEDVITAGSANVKTEADISFLTFLKLCLAVVILLFVILLISQMVSSRKKRKRRYRRNVSGRNRNQHK